MSDNKTVLGRDSFNLIFCMNCGKIKTFKANGICTPCMRDYINLGWFNQKDLDRLMNEGINATKKKD